MEITAADLLYICCKHSIANEKPVAFAGGLIFLDQIELLTNSALLTEFQEISICVSHCCPTFGSTRNLAIAGVAQRLNCNLTSRSITADSGYQWK
jgi:hypothetical protein